MARYIDADKAYELARADDYYADFRKSQADLTSLKELIDDVPSADVKEVVRGEWNRDKATIKCSVCGFGMFTDGYFFMNGECISANNSDYKPLFCPNCGADMRGGAK